MCHTDQKQVKTLSKSVHKDVPCMGCHQKPGVAGSLTQKLDYMRWVLNFQEADKKKYQAEIDNRSCLRCHLEIKNQVASLRGIRMRHHDVIKAGYNCTDCHNAVAHGETVINVKRPSMDKCIGCHDGKTAGAHCELCHEDRLQKPGKSGNQRRFKRDYTRLALASPKDCRGCHNIKAECTVCHGVEMPHSKDYRQGKHAGDGLLKKDTCFRCHRTEYEFCNKCHRFPSPHGPADSWKLAHAPAANNPEFLVYWPQAGESFKGCGACHSRKICRACHDDGRMSAK